MVPVAVVEDAVQIRTPQDRQPYHSLHFTIFISSTYFTFGDTQPLGCSTDSRSFSFARCTYLYISTHPIFFRLFSHYVTLQRQLGRLRLLFFCGRLSSFRAGSSRRRWVCKGGSPGLPGREGRGIRSPTASSLHVFFNTPPPFRKGGKLASEPSSQQALEKLLGEHVAGTKPPISSETSYRVHIHRIPL